MKLKLLDLKAQEKGTVTLPTQFTESYRPDLIKRAVVAVTRRQPYGALFQAGMRHSAKLSRRRRKYRGSYGFGISRVPRKILSRKGTRFSWVGANAPGTVGGPEAHPPKPSKKHEKKINTKERRKAIRCALTASMNKEVVAERGHRVPENYPFIITKDLEAIQKAKEFKEVLTSLGLSEELERTKEKTIRAGKGKARGRRYKRKTGPLVVVSEDCPIKKIHSIPGIDIVNVKELNAKLLAPGTTPGRLTIFSEKAIQRIQEEKLFQ